MWSSSSGHDSSYYGSSSHSQSSFYHDDEAAMHPSSHAYGASYSSMRRRRQGPVSRLGAALGEHVSSELKKPGVRAFLRRYKLVLAVHAFVLLTLLALWGGLRGRGAGSSHRNPAVGLHNYSRARAPSHYPGSKSSGKLRRTGGGGGTKGSGSGTSIKGQPNPPRFAPGALPTDDMANEPQQHTTTTKKEKGESKGRARRQEFLSNIATVAKAGPGKEEEEEEGQESSPVVEAAVGELEEEEEEAVRSDTLPFPTAATAGWPEAPEASEEAQHTATPTFVTTRAGEPIAVISPPCAGEGSCPTATPEKQTQHRYQQQMQQEMQQQQEEEEKGEEMVGAMDMDPAGMVAKGPTYVPASSAAVEEKEEKEEAVPAAMCGGAGRVLEEQTKAEAAVSVRAEDASAVAESGGQEEGAAAVLPAVPPEEPPADAVVAESGEREEEGGVGCDRGLLDEYVAAMLGR